MPRMTKKAKKPEMDVANIELDNEKISKVKLDGLKSEVISQESEIRGELFLESPKVIITIYSLTSSNNIGWSFN